MLVLMMVVVRAVALALRGHEDLASEHLALRPQLASMQRAPKRPRLQTSDRLFWVLLR
jgi:hypothetical protein